MSAAADTAFATQRTTVAIVWCYAGEGGDLLIVQTAKFREVSQKGVDDRRSDSRHTALMGSPISRPLSTG